MKYWVYKESRILGPFDKEGVSGLPGLDQGTLVCEGDPAGGSWLPVGEISDLSGLTPAAPEFGDVPTTAGLLDQLQIDTAGLVGDDDFPGALAEDLFRDADLKSSFGDVLSAGSGGAADAETRRAKEKVSELTIQLEHLYRHIAQLESGQTDLARRLAEKELQLRQGGIADAAAPAPEAAGPARTFLSPAPPPPAGAKVSPPPPLPVADAPAAPSEWAQPGALPAIFGGAEAPSKLVVPGVPAPPALPAMPSFTPPAAPALPAAAATPVEPPPAAPVEAPKAASFGKPKSFKVVPTVKAFKVLGAENAAPSPNPVPEFSTPEAAAPVEAAPVTPPPPAPVTPPPPPAPLEAIAPAPAPVVLTPIAPPPPPPVTVAPPAEVPNPFTIPTPAPANPAPPMPTPVAPPPNTLSRSQPVPDLTSGDMVGSDDATTNMPPATLARGRVAAPAGPVDSAVAARFAKPEPPPATAEPKPVRNNKPFLIAGGVLLLLLVVTGVIFMRQPKEDLKHMATLDDGKAPIGVPADEAAAPPMVKPKVAQPAPAAAPAPPPGPSPEHKAAIEAVKDFPLDGGRGSVGQWLQYSYTASPGAGAEEWNASDTSDATILVEYRLVPGAAGGKGALYLFEVDRNGLVMGKNIEARQMLAGGPPPDAPKAKKKAKAPAKKAKRRPVVEEPKEVPLLPLPDSGELRPPAEDDGTFGSDTINSGI